MTERRYVEFVEGSDLWRKAEKVAPCNCGLAEWGYVGSWAVSHSKDCPVSEVYRALVVEAAKAATRSEAVG